MRYVFHPWIIPCFYSLVIVDFEDNEISAVVKNRQRAKLKVDSKIPDSTPFRLSLFETDLQQTAGEQVFFRLFILGSQFALIKVFSDFSGFIDFSRFLHFRDQPVDVLVC